MNFQGVVMNVADLNRSIEFYREVLGFTLLSQKEQLAAVSAPGSDQPQVIVLRAFGSSPVGGARHIGLRAFLLEVDSADLLEQIAGDLASRRLLVSRRDHSEWIAVAGRDPDGVAVVIAAHPGGGRITADGWRTLDDSSTESASRSFLVGISSECGTTLPPLAGRPGGLEDADVEKSVLSPPWAIRFRSVSATS